MVVHFGDYINTYGSFVGFCIGFTVRLLGNQTVENVLINFDILELNQPLKLNRRFNLEQVENHTSMCLLSSTTRITIMKPDNRTSLSELWPCCAV